MNAKDFAALTGLPATRKNKYGNEITIVDNVKFASKREANRYAELKILEAAGKISQLLLQPRYRLEIEGILIATYVGDFAYWHHHVGRVVVEDSKGVKTRVYLMKKQLMLAIHGIDIVEV